MEFGGLDDDAYIIAARDGQIGVAGPTDDVVIIVRPCYGTFVLETAFIIETDGTAGEDNSLSCESAQRLIQQGTCQEC